jgi:hypothetical protein
MAAIAAHARGGGSLSPSSPAKLCPCRTRKKSRALVRRVIRSYWLLALPPAKMHALDVGQMFLRARLPIAISRERTGHRGRRPGTPAPHHGKRLFGTPSDILNRPPPWKSPWHAATAALWSTCAITGRACRKKRCHACSTRLTRWRTRATPQAAASVWGCPSRGAPSNCKRAEFARNAQPSLEVEMELPVAQP